MDQWTGRLSEYLDDELTLTDRVALERHLEQCEACRAVLADLRAVIRRAELLEDAPPASDLWEGIAQRIAQPELRVIDIASERTRRRPIRVSFTVPQLAAASVVLMLTGGAFAWLLAGGIPVPGTALLPADPVVQQVATRTTDAESPYAEAVATLETALDARRAQLDTSTVRVLEQNLHAIDQAIAEARQALERDPSSVYLNRHLENTLKKKVELLRIAAGMRRAST